MNIDLNDAIVRLNPHNSFQMRDARGACIHVHWGDLWITQEGDRKDHIVKAGESFAISNSGTALLSALNEAGVSVMKKCSESAVATIANIGAIVPAATRSAAGTGALEYGAAADESDFDDSRVTHRLPRADEIAQHVARAERIRARVFSDAISSGWRALRRSLSLVREIG